MPTILEAVEVKTSASFDGRSFLPLLLGKTQTGWDAVYTQFNHIIYIHGRTPVSDEINHPSSDSYHLQSMVEWKKKL